ncbi:ubiquinol-cytochrome c reductase iron-sulfur subunit [Marinobacter sp.]|uniref:QcrA and Rieske domain-containing protein n=1 Tax=Marinobacter sp. TaxID=50741 RepID=UPI003BAC2E68
MKENDKSCCSCNCSSTEETVDTSRRGFITKLALGVAAMHLPISAVAVNEKEASSLPPQVGDRLTYRQKSRRGPMLKPGDLEIADKQLAVVPVDPDTGIVRDGSRYNEIMLSRFDPAELDDLTTTRAAEGVVAYSTICTHDGCSVSTWDSEKHQLVCPCHHSIFDPKAGGALVSGPAYRSLPALPLAVEDGYLVVAASFTKRVGGGMK